MSREGQTLAYVVRRIAPAAVCRVCPSWVEACLPLIQGRYVGTRLANSWFWSSYPAAGRKNFWGSTINRQYWSILDYKNTCRHVRVRYPECQGTGQWCLRQTCPWASCAGIQWAEADGGSFTQFWKARSYKTMIERNCGLSQTMSWPWDHGAGHVWCQFLIAFFLLASINLASLPGPKFADFQNLWSQLRETDSRPACTWVAW